MTITLSSSINELDLSTRTKNVLHRGNIHSVEDLLSFRPENYHKLRNAGEKSIQQIKETVSELYALGFDDLSAPDGRTVDIRMKKTFVDTKGVEVYDTSIETLGLSGRLYNKLRSLNIYYVSDMMTLKPEALKQSGKIGDVTLAEFEKVRDSFTFVEMASTKYCDDIFDIYQEIAQHFPVSLTLLHQQMIMVFDNYPSKIDRAQVVLELQKNDMIREFSKTTICDAIKNDTSGATVDVLKRCIPTSLYSDAFFADILWQLQSQSLIRTKDDILFHFSHPTVNEYLDSLENAVAKECVLLRLEGDTFSEIASRFLISKERVRQIAATVWKNAPYLLEDRYKELFQESSFSIDEFTRTYNEPPSTYLYLKMRYKRILS